LNQPGNCCRPSPGVEMKEMEHDREDGLCGGSVLTLIGATPDAADTGERRLQEALDIGVSDVVALCPCCQFQLRVTADKKGLPVTIHDLPHLAAQSLGP
jgi:Fe-S oxidoreductase